jgi:ribonuclease/clavin/mitogillin
VYKALITHWHHDHVQGIPDLLKICPQATVHKHIPDEGQTDIEDGQVFKVDGATLRAFHTPGHTVDHMSFIFEEEDAIFTGDSRAHPASLSFFSNVAHRSQTDVLGHGTAVFEDLDAYMSSLHKMQSQVSGRAYPGHGAVIGNATAKIVEYIKHRQQREEEVLRVLRFGKVDVDADAGSPSPERRSSWAPIELVKVIYHNVPENLHLPACHGIIQVLMKLEKEGKVEHDLLSGKWRLGPQRPVL